MALAEERASRRKHAGGSEHALRAVLAAVGRRADEVDRWVLSTCGETAAGSPSERRLGRSLGASLRDLGVAPERVAWAPSHHLSHARAAALAARPHDLVAVVDDAGSDLDGSGAYERASAFQLGPDGGLRLVERVVGGEPGGVGTLYRRATSMLGFDGYTQSGKTMALAAFGARPAEAAGAARLLDPEHPTLAATDAEARLRTLLDSGPRPPRWRHRGLGWDDRHAELAALVQEASEEALLRWLERLVAQLAADGAPPPRRIVVSGGVALNCRAMGRLDAAGLAECVAPFHAAGDTGQALGNALLGADAAGLRVPASAASPFLGPPPTDADVERSVRALTGRPAAWRAAREVAPELARDLEAGGLVAVFAGRSELGPRALGHRSILASPARDVTAELNDRKGREAFRPFGLAALPETARRLAGRPVDSPAMLLAVPLAADAPPLAAGVHADGTARLQTVRSDGPALLRLLLEARAAATGVGALVNTSLNGPGEAIVETPAQAIETFRRLRLDRLVLAGDRPGRCVVLRREPIAARADAA